MLRAFYRFINRIKKIIGWLPIIWDDYDWDEVYLYIIIRHKLKLMEKFFRSDSACTLSAIKKADEMHKCICALDRLINNDYHSLAGGKILDKKWGSLEMNTTPSLERGYCCLHISRDKIITYDDEIKCDYASKQVYKKEEELLEQDKFYLFNYMAKHIDGWWD